MKQRSKTIKFLSRVFRLWKKMYYTKLSYTPTHRIINIEQENSSDYIVTIQLIGKNVIQKIAPEELLANDTMVNCFSPTDIRTLTYLGYLDINAPKYRILAKQLSQKHDQILFALYKKGEPKFSVLTANEIIKNQEIINGLSQQEAYMLGMTHASEQKIVEEKQKELLQKKLHNRN
jgi:hypothetical protein